MRQPGDIPLAGTIEPVGAMAAAGSEMNARTAIVVERAEVVPERDHPQQAARADSLAACRGENFSSAAH